MKYCGFFVVAMKTLEVEYPFANQVYYKGALDTLDPIYCIFTYSIIICVCVCVGNDIKDESNAWTDWRKRKKEKEMKGKKHLFL